MLKLDGGLRHMSITELKHMSKEADGVRRVEVFTGAGRRRSWSAEEKASIVAESHAAGDTVCSVARRHGLTPQQLFAWRRQARAPAASHTDAPPLFVPAVVEAEPPPANAPKARRARRSRADGVIEVAIDGVSAAQLSALLEGLNWRRIHEARNDRTPHVPA
jgi:transposase